MEFDRLLPRHEPRSNDPSSTEVGSGADSQKHQRRYVPDFLVEYEDGRKAIIEVKDPSRLDSNDVQHKRKAAEIWCKQRSIEYVVATIG